MTQQHDMADSKIPTLRKRKDFLRIAGMRKKWNAPGMIVQTAPQPKDLDPDTPKIRVGYTASKKVGNAPARSRVKRRLREVVRLVLADAGQQGYDYVLIGRKETLERSFDDLIRDLKWCIKRLSSAPQSSLKNTIKKNG